MFNGYHLMFTYTGKFITEILFLVEVILCYFLNDPYSVVYENE